MIHHKFLGNLFQFTVNLVGVETLHMESKSLITQQEHIDLINKRLYIIKGKHPVIEVLIMHPVIELPVQVIFGDSVKFPFIVLHYVLQYKTT